MRPARAPTSKDGRRRYGRARAQDPRRPIAGATRGRRWVTGATTARPFPVVRLGVKGSPRSPPPTSTRKEQRRPSVSAASSVRRRTEDRPLRRSWRSGRRSPSFETQTTPAIQTGRRERRKTFDTSSSARESLPLRPAPARSSTRPSEKRSPISRRRSNRRSPRSTSFARDNRLGTDRRSPSGAAGQRPRR